MKKRQLTEMEKYAESMSKYKHKCKCGANVYLSTKHPKKICKWCKNVVYLDKKQEFIDKIKNKLKK